MMNMFFRKETKKSDFEVEEDNEEQGQTNFPHSVTADAIDDCMIYLTQIAHS